MEASKVNIDPSLLSGDLSRKRKNELRQERVIELIKSKPSGAHIKHREFGDVTGMKPNNVGNFLHRLAKRGVIKIEKLTPFETTYSVVEELEHKAHVEWKTVEKHDHNSDVIDLARRYFWETKDDSLHNFVEWVAKIK